MGSKEVFGVTKSKEAAGAKVWKVKGTAHILLRVHSSRVGTGSSPLLFPQCLEEHSVKQPEGSSLARVGARVGNRGK